MRRPPVTVARERKGLNGLFGSSEEETRPGVRRPGPSPRPLPSRPSLRRRAERATLRRRLRRTRRRRGHKAGGARGKTLREPGPRETGTCSWPAARPQVTRVRGGSASRARAEGAGCSGARGRVSGVAEGAAILPGVPCSPRESVGLQSRVLTKPCWPRRDARGRWVGGSRAWRRWKVAVVLVWFFFFPSWFKKLQSPVEIVQPLTVIRVSLPRHT